MAITPTALLSLPLITTGTESGAWGDVVDNGLTSYLDIAIAGGLAITVTTANVTLANTAGTSSATNIGSSTAQYAILNVSGAMTADRSLILPSFSRQYVINNSCTGGYVLTVKGAATTGITLRNSESAQVAWNGSDFVKVGPGASITGTNTAVGASALIKTTTTGAQNTGVGANALYFNVVGSQNTAIGSSAGYYNTGNYNTALGCQALYGSSGEANTAVGVSALLGNVGGNYNVGLGYTALQNNTSGSGNTAIQPLLNTGSYSPVFDPTTQSNRFCMGSTSVTNAYIQVAWTVVSDARDKTNFASIPHGLDFVNQLQPTAFQFRVSREDDTPTGPVRYGFKAQDVLALEGSTPVVVDAEDSEKLRFNESSLIPILVKAIQELKAEFDAYKATHA